MATIRRIGFYPAEIFADKIYCTRENRKWLKDKNTRLAGMALQCHSFSAWEEMKYCYSTTLNAIDDCLNQKTKSKWEDGPGFTT